MHTGPELAAMTSKHVESFHRALDSVARERQHLTFLEAPPLEQTRDYVLNGLRKGDPRIVVLAEGDVVGWCDIGGHPFPTHAHRGTLGMGLLPAFRGRGLGHQLIKATLDQAWTSGFTRVELHVYADNAPAIALYTKVGFAREGVTRDAILIDGVYRDAIDMAIIRRHGLGKSRLSG